MQADLQICICVALRFLHKLSINIIHYTHESNTYPQNYQVEKESFVGFKLIWLLPAGIYL